MPSACSRHRSPRRPGSSRRCVSSARRTLRLRAPHPSPTKPPTRPPPPMRQPPTQTRPLPPKRTNTMAKMSTDDLLDAFKEMTLLELSEFVKQFEDTFGVTAAAPVAVAAAPGGGGGAAEAPAAEEQDEFDVILEAAGDKKIQ